MTTLAARTTKTGARCRAVGYVRRSTDRQEQSIPDQKSALEAYSAEHGLRLGKFYVDDAVSGTSSVGRRAFQQMIQAAQSTARPFDLDHAGAVVRQMFRAEGAGDPLSQVEDQEASEGAVQTGVLIRVRGGRA